jgi:hypothetical protein
MASVKSPPSVPRSVMRYRTGAAGAVLAVAMTATRGTNHARNARTL